MAHISKTVSAGARLYYLDIREDKKGNSYLSVTEMNTRNHSRNCIYIHPENVERIIDALNEIKESLPKRQ